MEKSVKEMNDEELNSEWLKLEQAKGEDWLNGYYQRYVDVENEIAERKFRNLGHPEIQEQERLDQCQTKQ